MSLELMQRWVASLPPSERNLPLLHVGNVFYTPLQALEEVKKGTVIGEKLQKLVEEGRFGTDLTALAKARLSAILEANKQYKIMTLSGRVLQVGDLAKKVQEGDWDDPAIRTLLAAEIKLAEYNLNLAKKVGGVGSGESGG